MAWIRNDVRSDSVRASRATLVIAEKIATPDNSRYPAAMPVKNLIALNGIEDT